MKLRVECYTCDDDGVRHYQIKYRKHWWNKWKLLNYKNKLCPILFNSYEDYTNKEITEIIEAINNIF